MWLCIGGVWWIDNSKFVIIIMYIKLVKWGSGLYLKKTFTAFTCADSIMLTGCVVPTNSTAALTGWRIDSFRRRHPSIPYPGAFQSSMLQGHGRTVKWRDMLLRRQEEWVILAWLSILMLPQRRMLLCRRAEGEKRELLSHGGLIGHCGRGCYRVWAVRGVPDRCRLALKARCRGRSCSIDWTAIVVRATWWQRFIKAVECKGTWVAAINLEIIQLEDLVLHLWVFSYGVAEGNGRGRRRCGYLAGVGIKLPHVAIPHQGVDAGQWRCRQLVLLATDVHHQFSAEVRIQTVRAEVAVMGQGCILGLYTGHR